MNDFVQFFMGAVSGHPLPTYGLVFLMAMAEALPVAGTVVPGSAIIVGVGALVPTGAIGLWPLLVVAFLGAAAGDGASYWLGHHYQRAITGVWPFRRYPALINRGESFFRHHGGKGVFLARFVQGPRAFVPLAAGILHMPPPRFFAVNLASALVWAPAHILAGALLGASLQVAGAIAGRLAIALVLVILILWLAAWLGRRALFRWGLPALEAVQRRAVSWAAQKDSWLRRQVLALFDPERAESGPLLLGGALLIGSLWLFVAILEDVVTRDPLVRADTAVFHFLQNLRTLWMDRVMVAITDLGDGPVIAAVAAMGALWLLLRRAWRTAGYWLGAVASAELFTLLLKRTLHQSRPEAGLYAGWDAYSFPSGHTTVNTVLYGFLAFLAARHLRPPRQMAIAAAASTWVAAIGFSRLYLGAHWLSDVAAGFAAGTAWVALLAIGYSRHQRPGIGKGGFVAVTLLTLVLAGGLHLRRSYGTDLTRYARRIETRTLAYAAWQTGAWRLLPARRVDLGGAWEEPLVLQWAGDLKTLQERLTSAGWLLPRPWSARSALAWLRPDAAPLQLPVLPRLEDGFPPSLTLVRGPPESAAADTRLVLQVWDARTLLAPRAAPAGIRLWFGMVAEQRLLHPLHLLTVTEILPDFDSARATLARSLGSARLVYRPQERVSGWDGGVLLASDEEGIPPQGKGKTAGETLNAGQARPVFPIAAEYNEPRSPIGGGRDAILTPGGYRCYPIKNKEQKHMPTGR